MASESAKASAEIFMSMVEKTRLDSIMTLPGHRSRAERIIQRAIDAATSEQGRLVDGLASLVVRLSRKCSEGRLAVEAIDFINDHNLRVDGN